MRHMPQSARRLNVTLDPAYAAKLSKLAERTHVNEGTQARSLLTQALDEADPDPRHVAASWMACLARWSGPIRDSRTPELVGR